MDIDYESKTISICQQVTIKDANNQVSFESWVIITLMMVNMSKTISEKSRKLYNLFKLNQQIHLLTKTLNTL